MRRVLFISAGLAILLLAGAIWFSVSSQDGASPSGASGAPAPTSTRGPLPGATPTSGSEVQSPAPQQTDQGVIPPRTSTDPLLSEPLPASGSAEGQLVDGFPADVMGPASDSQVVSSAIATEGSVMQVTLVARTDSSAADVTAHYRDLWANLGLTPQDSAGAAGTSSTGRGASLTLAFSPDSATGTVYTILATFRAG